MLPINKTCNFFLKRLGQAMNITKELTDEVILCCTLTLLHKSADVLTTPIPGQTYPTTFVTGMPRAVKPFRTATRTWNSAT